MCLLILAVYAKINDLDFFWPNRHLGSNLRRPTYDRRLPMLHLPWPTEHGGVASGHGEPLLEPHNKCLNTHYFPIRDMIRGAGYIANRWIRYSPWIERAEALSTTHITTAHALSYRWAVHRAPLAPHHHRGHGRLPQAPATLPRPHIQERTTGAVRLYRRRHPLPAVFRAQVNPWARANPRCGYGLGPRGLWGRFYTQGQCQPSPTDRYASGWGIRDARRGFTRRLLSPRGQRRSY
jgi:hypothetical protein